MKPCQQCGTTKGHIRDYNFNEDGYPTLINGTDIRLCPDCWEVAMKDPHISK